MRRRLTTLLFTSFALLGCSSDTQPAGKADDKQAKAGEQKGAPTPEVKTDKPEADKQKGGGELAPKPAEPTAEPTPTEPGTPALAADNEPKIEVLSTGSEPRQQLRFSPSEGQSEVMVMTMNMELTIDMGPGAPVPPTTQKTPPITMYNTSTIEKVAEGQITQKVVFDRYEMGEGPDGTGAMMAAAMGQAFDQMKGFEQRMVYDTRGAVLSGDWSVPPGMDPQLAANLQNVNQSLEQAMLRLPEEAIGVGAKWKEISEIENNGLKIEQTAEYTVESIDDKKVTVSTVITQAPKSKKLDIPNMPMAEVDLLEFDSKGTGKIELELDHMVPAMGTSKMDTSLTIEAAAGGQKQKITTKIKLDLQISRQAPAPAGG